MKKFICAVLCLVLLCSCSAESKVRVVNKDICYTAHISFLGKEFKAWCETGNEYMDFLVEQGAQGLNIRVYGDKAVLEYEEKEITLIPTQYQNTFYNLLYEVHRYFDGDYTVEENDDIYKVLGTVQGKEFEMIVSPTGYPIELSIKEIGLLVKYYDILVKKQ